MSEKVRLYDAFGELIYALAMADGLIQPEETEALNNILQNHPWAKEIQWSFDYEKNMSTSLEEAYKNAVDACQFHGPDPEYQFFMEVLEKVAEASDGIDDDENSIIYNFKKDLTEKFMRDIERGLR